VPNGRNCAAKLGRLDTIFFLISAMVVVDTIGAIAIGGGEAFTWLVVLFLFFFIPSALASAELGAAIPEEGGGYVWVRTAFGRYAGALTSLLYWAGTPMWLGGSVAVVAMSVYQRFIGDLSGPASSSMASVMVCMESRWGICRHPGGLHCRRTGAAVLLRRGRVALDCGRGDARPAA